VDKPETEEALKQDTEWTNQRHGQHWNKTQIGQIRDTCSIRPRHRMVKPVTSSIEIRHMMDKLQTQATLRKDRKWKNQRHRQY
jgi:hypothetical protein